MFIWALINTLVAFFTIFCLPNIFILLLAIFIIFNCNLGVSTTLFQYSNELLEETDEETNQLMIKCFFRTFKTPLVNLRFAFLLNLKPLLKTILFFFATYFLVTAGYLELIYKYTNAEDYKTIYTIVSSTSFNIDSFPATFLNAINIITIAISLLSIYIFIHFKRHNIYRYIRNVPSFSILSYLFKIEDKQKIFNKKHKTAINIYNLIFSFATVINIGIAATFFYILQYQISYYLVGFISITIFFLIEQIIYYLYLDSLLYLINSDIKEESNDTSQNEVVDYEGEFDEDIIAEDENGESKSKFQMFDMDEESEILFRMDLISAINKIEKVEKEKLERIAPIQSMIFKSVVVNKIFSTKLNLSQEQIKRREKERKKYVKTYKSIDVYPQIAAYIREYSNLSLEELQAINLDEQSLERLFVISALINEKTQ